LGSRYWFLKIIENAVNYGLPSAFLRVLRASAMGLGCSERRAAENAEKRREKERSREGTVDPERLL
jgi:hypothetical protein